jgi:hypothetical protein
MEAMRACEPGGYVARTAYPNRKYYKDANGVFMKAARVDYIDFIATDWEPYSQKIKNFDDIKNASRFCPV